MKKLSFLSFLLISLSSFSQDTTFTFTKYGFTDFVVGKAEGKTKADLYKRTLDWIAVTYNNPNEVIKAKIENDYVRFEGSTKDMLCMSTLGMATCDPSTYQVEVSLKDGKYKFDVIEVRDYTSPSQYSAGGWSTVKLPPPGGSDEEPLSYYFKKDGEPKSTWKAYVLNIPETFNKLNSSLKAFLNNENIPSKSSDW